MSDKYELIRIIKKRRKIYLIAYVLVWVVGFCAAFLIGQQAETAKAALVILIVVVCLAGIIAGLMEVCCMSIGSLYNDGAPSFGGLTGIICLLLSYFVIGWVIYGLVSISDTLYGIVTGLN